MVRILPPRSLPIGTANHSWTNSPPVWPHASLRTPSAADPTMSWWFWERLVRKRCSRCPSKRQGNEGGTSFSSACPRPAFVNRSEEHTSELQSLMRISYAVFCLKKKKLTHNTHQQ